MSEIHGLKCDGCGKETQSSKPAGWIRDEYRIFGTHLENSDPEKVHFCSEACGVRYWTNKVRATEETASFA